MLFARHLQILLLLLIGAALAACSAPSDLEVAEEFSAAFVEGDVDALESLSTDLAALGTIPWRAQFLSALDLEAESSTCLGLETQITCTIVGHNARTKLLYPDYTVKRSLHLTIEDGVVTRGSFEFASPEIPLDAFNLWAAANRPDVLEGPCADIDGTSDPAVCAAAVLEVAGEYLAATGG
ncbi:MAG: hypothetical protein KJO17_05150 [Acidimicrobiia bacterium]|nr:hypothetical protein [Acidimicrobiia bacterium]